MRKLRQLLMVAALSCVALVARAEYSIETIAEGLDFPWSIAFLPGGDMLVSERSGQLRVIRDGRLLDKAVDGVPETFVAGQGGLFDVILDPAFVDNQRIYLSFAFGNASANATRVVRARFDGGTLSEQEILFTASPMKDTPHHYGGRMVFLPDGTLLLTTGEGFNYREEAQRLDNHLGKVIRIDTDGNAPPDNPFTSVTGARDEIWSFGHRNAQGIIVLPQSGAVMLHEHGPRGGDELNLIEPGLNYGWPGISHGIDYSGAGITPYKEYPGMQQALVYWVPSIAPSGMTHYNGALFPDWLGDLFISTLAEKSVRRLNMRETGVFEQEILFTELGERIRDVRQGPDGALYLLTDSSEGRVLRVAPAQ